MKRDIYYIVDKDNKYLIAYGHKPIIWTKYKYRASFYTDLEIVTKYIFLINNNNPNRLAKLKKETREIKTPKYKWIKQ